MVGSFVFLVQMGTAEFLTDQGTDARPHPHIGLATVTYLYNGEFQHRVSFGTKQMIYPGEVNWMIAGNGVTHSERTFAASANLIADLSIYFQVDACSTEPWRPH